MDVAYALEQLMDHLQYPRVNGIRGKRMRTKTQCYPIILERTDVAESAFHHYLSFFKFMKNYPRFLHSLLTFNEIRENNGMIQRWFREQQGP